MTNKYTGDNTLRQNPLLLLLLLAITIFLGYLVGTLFVDFSLRILFHSTITEIVNTKDSISLLLVQGITSFFSFLLAPGIFAKVWMKMDVQELFQGRVNHHLTLMTLVLLVVIVPFNSFLVEYNADLQMPSFLAEFEQYAQDMEKKLEELVLSMLSFDSIPQLILAIFVIGFIPAVGEELLFRGLIQKTFVSSIKNPYLAIILLLPCSVPFIYSFTVLFRDLC